MAARFWVGGSGNWSDNTNHWSATSGGSPGASKPIAGDDATFDTLSNATGYTVTIDAAAVCQSFNFGLPLSGVPTLAGTFTLTITGAGTAFSLATGTVRTYNGSITFNGSGANTITTNGVTMSSSVTVSSGSWTLQDNYSSGSNTFSLTAGTFNTNGKTVTFGTSQFTGATAKVLTLGATIWNCTVWNYSGSNLTLNQGTSSIRISASGTFTGGGATYNDVQYLACAAASVVGTNTFATFSVTGTAASTCFLSFLANQTFTTSFTVTGNSTTAKMYIRSDVKGTARTLTSPSVVSTNGDFQDITGAGAGWNLSAATGGSGDCGGNTNITFTTGATQYWFKDTGSWSNVALWFLATNGGGGAGRVPLPQDDVVFDSNSFSTGTRVVTCDVSRSGKNISTSAVTNNPAFNFGNIAKSWFGSVTMGTHTISTGVALITLEGRGSFTFTSAGLTQISPFTLDAPGGSYTQQDAFAIGATLTLTVTNGTWSTGTNFSKSVGLLSSSNLNTRTINLNNSTLTLTGTGNVIDTNTSTGLTWTLGGTSNVIVSDTSATSKTILTSQNFDSLTITGDNVIKQSDSTVTTLNVNTAGRTNGFKIFSSSTQTVTNFTTNGSAGNLAKLSSSSGGAAHTLTKSSGTISVDYMSIQDSTATGGATFYAGANSTNVSGNTGWIFTAPPPAGSGTGNMFMVF